MGKTLIKIYWHNNSIMKQENEFLLTIAIPFYNAEKYLDTSIQSVFNQTFQDWNLLLIDDGSTDSSLQIALKYQNDPRVKIHSDGENKNLSYRLNQIPTLVDTKYLFRMDADDIMHPERIERQLNILESHPEIDVLGTNAYSMDENNLIQGIRLRYSDKENLRKVKDFTHPTIAAKTEWFKNNPYDAKAIRIEDMELWIRLKDQCNFQILTEPLLFYREFGSDYYKKYFKAYNCLPYVLKKHHYDFGMLKFIIKFSVKGILYFFFNLLDKEGVLVNRRNEIRLNKLTVEEVLKK
jgi:glycosyltransferase involved in cell wall biosynthesis